MPVDIAFHGCLDGNLTTFEAYTETPHPFCTVNGSDRLGNSVSMYLTPKQVIQCVEKFAGFLAAIAPDTLIGLPESNDTDPDGGVFDDNRPVPTQPATEANIVQITAPEPMPAAETPAAAVSGANAPGVILGADDLPQLPF